MTVAFDTTVGGSSSTSYVTVAEFATYMEKLPFDDNLPKSTQTTLIKKLLNMATEQLDGYMYDGSPTNFGTQALEFPRVGIADKWGFTISDSTIPQQLKDAVCEMAIFLFQNNANNASTDGWNNDEPTSVSISSEISMTYTTKSKPANAVPNRVKFLLRQMGTAWIETTGRVVRS